MAHVLHTAHGKQLFLEKNNYDDLYDYPPNDDNHNGYYDSDTCQMSNLPNIMRQTQSIPPHYSTQMRHREGPPPSEEGEAAGRSADGF